jgi:hypothetical protein
MVITSPIDSLNRDDFRGRFNYAPLGALNKSVMKMSFFEAGNELNS